MCVTVLAVMQAIYLGHEVIEAVAPCEYVMCLYHHVCCYYQVVNIISMNRRGHRRPLSRNRFLFQLCLDPLLGFFGKYCAGFMVRETISEEIEPLLTSVRALRCLLVFSQLMIREKKRLLGNWL